MMNLRTFFEAAQARGYKTVRYALEEPYKQNKDKVKECDIVYNNTALEFAIEFKKTIEALGKKVSIRSNSNRLTEISVSVTRKNLRRKLSMTNGALRLLRESADSWGDFSA